MSPSRCRLILAVLTFVPLAGALLSGVFWAGSSTDGALRDLLRAETAVGVEIWRETRDPVTLDRLFPERWHFSDRTDPSLDETTLHESREGLVGKAAVYDADSWFQLGTFSLIEEPDRFARTSIVTWLTIVAALLSLAAVCRLWSRTNKRPVLHPAIALLVLLMAFWVIGGKKNRALEGATAARLSLAANALRAVPDVEAWFARPGGIYRLTGLNFILRDIAGGTEFSVSLPQRPKSWSKFLLRLKDVIMRIGSSTPLSMWNGLVSYCFLTRRSMALSRRSWCWPFWVSSQRRFPLGFRGSSMSHSFFETMW